MSKQPKPVSKKYTDLISEIQKGQLITDLIKSGTALN